MPLPPSVPQQKELWDISKFDIMYGHLTDRYDDFCRGDFDAMVEARERYELDVLIPACLFDRA